MYAMLNDSADLIPFCLHYHEDRPHRNSFEPRFDSIP